MHQSRHLRIPDWGKGCIDSKRLWIWSWGTSAALLLACICTMFSPWMIYKIRSNVTYELGLRFVDAATPLTSDTTVIRIYDDLKVRVGDATFDISFPELRNSEEWWRMEPVWRGKVREAILKEFKKHPISSTIVIRVDPDVRYEVIAVVWTSIQANSKANLYLDVVANQ